MRRARVVSRSSLAASEIAAIEAAEAVAQRAYAPYSGFRVGAALLTESDEPFLGCNVENATYGLTVCAERSAVSAAVAAGAHSFLLCAIWTDSEAPSVPCGACRQVLAEFNPTMRLLIACAGDDVRIATLDELLPEAFQLDPGEV